MNFSRLSIQRPQPAILLFVLLTLCGLIAFARMPVQNTPDIDVPVVLLQTGLPGASPQQIESDLARKIESAVSPLSQVRHVTSTIADGTLAMSVEFRAGRNVNEAMTDVRDAVNRIRVDLPAEMVEPVISKPNDAGTDALLTYTLTSGRLDAAALSWLVDDTVVKALQKVPGVGAVHRVGGLSREILIELDPARMAALNVSATQISQQLGRIQGESPGGRSNIGGVNQTVRTLATVRSVAEIAALDMALADGRSVRLDQIARVSDTSVEPSQLVLLDGKPVVAFEVMRAIGAGDIAVARAVRHAVEGLGLDARGVDVHEALNGVDTVQSNYEGTRSLLFEGALLTVLVVGLFLRDGRATLVSAAALPLSVIPTFLVIHLMGFTLNLVTLLALALVIGVLVDDAIVEIENIMRHLRMGKTPRQAALDAADEIGLAVVATTATLVAVFLPTAFLKDSVGQYFMQFGWTAAISVLASLLVARLLTPMMAAFLFKRLPVQAEAPADGRVMSRYLRLVDACLNKRRRSVLLASAFFIGSLMLLPWIKTAFLPATDGVTTNIALELPPGSTLTSSRDIAEQARALLVRDPMVLHVYTVVGDKMASRSVLAVSLPPRAGRHATQKQINAGLRARLAELPGVRVNVVDGDAGDEAVFQLAGEDPEALKTAVLNVQREIRSIPGLGLIRSDISQVQPELAVTTDFARAADLGVTADVIAQTLRIATAGDYDHALAKLNLPDRQVPIRVRLPLSARQDIDLLSQLAVPAHNGNVPLSAVATLHVDSAPARIERRDGLRKVVVHVGLNGMDEDEVMDRIKDLPAMKNLGAGVHREKLGDAERVQELLGSFLLAVAIGALCIYLVLVLLFGELLQPLTVMSALPLSMGGAFGALLITGSSLSMPSLLGLLMLMGLSGKNSILLVDYALHARRERGLDRREALLEACRQRAKPIVMTSLAMSAGMLPIALGLGADASFRAPMAIAVIGGLVSSTALSLVLVPVLFTLSDDVGRWFARLGRRHVPALTLVSPAAPAHATPAPAQRPAAAATASGRPVWVPGAFSTLDDLP